MAASLQINEWWSHDMRHHFVYAFNSWATARLSQKLSIFELLADRHKMETKQFYILNSISKTKKNLINRGGEPIACGSYWGARNMWITSCSNQAQWFLWSKTTALKTSRYRPMYFCNTCQYTSLNNFILHVLLIQTVSVRRNLIIFPTPKQITFILTIQVMFILRTFTNKLSTSKVISIV